MKRLQFLLGLLTGVVLSLAISLGLFYYYVVTEIETLKKDTAEEYESIKNYWGELLENDYKKMQKDAVETLKGQVSDIQRNLMGEERDSIK